MIIFNGKNSKIDFDLYIASREQPPAQRKVITETVPYMSGLWDFSYHDGDIDEYEAVKIKYTFDIIAESKQELKELRKRLVAWIHSKGDNKLWDNDINGYYNVYHAQASWSEEGLQGLLTAEFTCYPFALVDVESVHTLSTTSQTINIENYGDRVVTPVIRVTSKNIFNKDAAFGGTGGELIVDGDDITFNYEGVTNDFFAVVCWVNVKPNTDYKISVASLKSIGSVYVYNDKLYGNIVAHPQPNGVFNSGNYTRLLIGFYTLAEFRDNTRTTETLSKIQIEEGEIATAYEPFVEANATLTDGSTSYALSAGTYEDKITLETGKNAFTVKGEGLISFIYKEEVL
jgi:hypothetical protein